MKKNVKEKLGEILSNVYEKLSDDIQFQIIHSYKYKDFFTIRFPYISNKELMLLYRVKPKWKLL